MDFAGIKPHVGTGLPNLMAPHRGNGHGGVLVFVIFKSMIVEQDVAIDLSTSNNLSQIDCKSPVF